MFKSIKKYFSGLSKNTFFLALASFFGDISTEMLYPIVPIFLTQTLMTSGSVIGLIEGVAKATQNIVQGFSGWFSDKLKKRKLIALIGFFLAAIAKPLMGISINWQGILGGRFLDRFGAGMRSAPRDALIASSVTPTNRGKAFGLEGFGDNLGAFLGPLLALFLFAVLHINIRFIFYLAFIPGILAFIMIVFVKENFIPVAAKSILVVRARRFPQIYWRYLLITGLFSIGNSSNAFLILQTHNIGASIKSTILIYAGFNFVSAIVSYPVGFFSDLFGRKYTLLVSFIIFIVTYLGFAMTKNLALITILFIFYGFYQGIFRSVGKALAMDFVPKELQASGIGWYAATIGLTELMASVVAGLLWDHINHEAVFIYGAVFAFLGSIAFLWLIPAKTLN